MNDQKSPLPVKQLVIFMIISVAAIVGWNYIQDLIWLPVKRLKPEEQRAVREHIAPLAGLAPTGAGLGDLQRFAGEELVRQMPPETRVKAAAEFAEAKKKENEARIAQQPKPPAFKPTLINLGNDRYNLQVRLTNKGGA